MPQIRGTQLQNLTIRDAQVADDAKIAQRKIDMNDPDGWISAGIMHVITTTTHPEWNGDQNGKLYYMDDSQELIIGTNTPPYYTTIGKQGGKWSVTPTRIDGNEATDWNSDTGFGTTYVSSVPMKLDGSNSLIYLNGVLHRIGSNYDYTILPDLVSVKFNYNISSVDVVTVVVYTDEDITSFLTDYVTKTQLRLPTPGNSGAMMVGLAPVQNMNSNNVQDAFAELKYQLDSSIQQYDHITTTVMASSGIDWNGTFSTTFRSSVQFALDGSNIFVYYNGQLQKLGVSDDYNILSETDIQLTFNATAPDRITITVMPNLSMSSYVTLMSLASTINGFSGASKIGVTMTAGITSNNLQEAIQDLALDVNNINSNMTYSSGKIGFFGNLPNYSLDVISTSRMNSKSGYLTSGKCYAQYFKAESAISDRDLVGVNNTTGLVRKYRSGDELVGICVLNTMAGYISNGDYDIERDNTYCLVGIKGKMRFDQTQVVLNGRSASTTDDKRVGVVLEDGDIFI